MVYLKTYYHKEKASDPVIEFHEFDTDMDALEYVQLSAQTKGLGLNPDPSVHYYEFLSKEDYEEATK